MGSCKEKLNKTKLNRLLKGLDYVFFNSVGSTFDVKQHDVVIAAHQSAGVGRLSRPFFCGLGGIYLCIKTPLMPMITVSAAAGVIRALQKIGIYGQVKWVNDIIVDGKKVAGILAKSDGKTATVGVGLNYCSTLPPQLQAIACNISTTTSGINDFAACLVFSLLDAFKSTDNFALYKSRLLGIGQQISLPNAATTATIKGISDAATTATINGISDAATTATIKGISDEGNLIYATKDGIEGILYYGDIHL